MSFLILKLVALFVQLIGAVTVASIDPTDSDAQSKANKGKTIALVGLGIQISCFGLFSVIAVRFNFTSKRFVAGFESRITGSINEKYCTIDGGDRKLKRNWPALLRCVNIACLLVLVRKLQLISFYQVCQKRKLSTADRFAPFIVSVTSLWGGRDTLKRTSGGKCSSISSMQIHLTKLSR